MTTGSVIFKGVVRGKTIELEREPGLPEGQEVTVTVEPAGTTGELPAGGGAGAVTTSPFETESTFRRLAPGEGLRRSAGSWADDIEGLDRYLDWNRQQRKLGRPGQRP